MTHLPDQAPSLRLLLGELRAGGTWVRARLQPVTQRVIANGNGAAAQGAPVITLPGFLAPDGSMAMMRQRLNAAGFQAKRWKMGFNLGARADTFDRLDARVRYVAAQAGSPVHLVGWSLGGVFAREYAKRHPDIVASVVTLGSPFSGSPRANNAWRLYQLVAGHPVDNPPVALLPDPKPPVPTYALWSRHDGVIPPAGAAGLPNERDRAIELDCVHLGFAYAPEVTRVVVTCLREAEALRSVDRAE